MEKRKIESYRKRFDNLCHNQDGIEYWFARDYRECIEQSRGNDVSDEIE